MGEAGAGQPGTLETGALETRLREIRRRLHGRPHGHAGTQIGLAEAGPFQAGVLQPGASEVGPVELDAVQGGAAQVGGEEVGETEIAAVQGGVREVDAAQDGLLEIEVAEPQSRQPGSLELGAFTTDQTTHEAVMPLDDSDQFLGGHARAPRVAIAIPDSPFPDEQNAHTLPDKLGAVQPMGSDGGHTSGLTGYFPDRSKGKVASIVWMAPPWPRKLE